MQEMIEPERKVDEIVEPGRFTDDVYQQASDVLEGREVYLSGPISHVKDDGVRWREEMIEDYGHEFEFLNPLDTYHPDEADILRDPIELDEDSEREQVLPQEYVSEDKMMISRSQCVFVGLPQVITRGTMLECGFAKWGVGIPFFVWMMDGQKDGWIYENAEYVSDSRDDVVDEIRRFLRDA